MNSIRDTWRKWRFGEGAAQVEQALGDRLLGRYPGVVMLLDDSGVVRHVNPHFERYAGHSAQQLIGRRATLLDIDPLHGEFARAIAGCVTTREPWEGVLMCRRDDGQLIHQATTITPLASSNGTELRLLVVQHDVSAVRELGIKDHFRLSWLESSVAHIPGVLFRLRQDVNGKLEFLFASQGIETLCGLTAEGVMADAQLLLGRVMARDRQRLATSLVQSAVSLEPWRLEFRLTLADGIHWLEGRGKPLRHRDGATLWDGLLIDISERKEVEQRVQRLVGTDMLTGALNRRAFFEQGEAALSRARRKGGRLPLAMLDLDHFKALNDTYGHAVGDMALETFAMTCRDCLRPYDLFARIGGEEFVVMLVDSDPEEAETVLERLRRAVEGIELDIEEKVIRFTVSIGLTILEPSGSLEAALTRADRALYLAKDGGRNRISTSTEQNTSRV
ncbi:sensor domain-containing diguanylate cyclase [Halomonas urumqiensis]|uniref:diguanylate cyclase n=1 Tax=Halomonas urumqiensis TaxID=1684789 RepID=A0A2N7UD88_9GAMM|nr:sensor domain-containing diguanylate cyclase [Halomonas urumqiensis]PMR78351.1 hypothetical protein C1H70_16465 [Halomonas urumqiensis]PTB03498.1 PAS domain S-box protein [Halomonas urumqiensis]GHE20314.1 sensor domain-containing diguanylate cyclase [Halomonas urumqiensis]